MDIRIEPMTRMGLQLYYFVVLFAVLQDENEI